MCQKSPFVNFLIIYSNKYSNCYAITPPPKNLTNQLLHSLNWSQTTLYKKVLYMSCLLGRNGCQCLVV